MANIKLENSEYFKTQVTLVPLTGLSPGTNDALVDTDTMLEAFQKLQAQIQALDGVGIGNAVAGGTETSVLFLGADGVLAQNNTALRWINADTQLKLTAGGVTKTPLKIILKII